MSGNGKAFALYQKIKQRIIKDIESGKLKPDDRVPSETELAKSFNASRMTANRALKELTEEKRIVRVQGVGSFVASPGPDGALLEIKSIKQEIEERGGIHSSNILVLEKINAPEKIRAKMAPAQTAKVYHSVIVHMDKGIPVQYSERFINPEVAPEYILQDFTRITPCDYLLAIAPVQQAEYYIEAVTCSDEAAAHLGIAPGEPCLSLTRRTWSFDMVATYSNMISPGSRYHLEGKYMRGQGR